MSNLVKYLFTTFSLERGTRGPGQRIALIHEYFEKYPLTNVNAVWQFNQSSLYYAASHNFSDVCLELIARGADLNHADDLGWTPLMAAASNGHLPVVQLLVDSGADLHCRDITGTTVLDIANSQKDISAFLQLKICEQQATLAAIVAEQKLMDCLWFQQTEYDTSVHQAMVRDAESTAEYDRAYQLWNETPRWHPSGIVLNSIKQKFTHSRTLTLMIQSLQKVVGNLPGAFEGTIWLFETNRSFTEIKPILELLYPFFNWVSHGCLLICCIGLQSSVDTAQALQVFQDQQMKVLVCPFLYFDSKFVQIKRSWIGSTHQQQLKTRLDSVMLALKPVRSIYKGKTSTGVSQFEYSWPTMYADVTLFSDLFRLVFEFIAIEPCALATIVTAYPQIWKRFIQFIPIPTQVVSGTAEVPPLVIQGLSPLEAQKLSIFRHASAHDGVFIGPKEDFPAWVAYKWNHHHLSGPNWLSNGTAPPTPRFAHLVFLLNVSPGAYYQFVQLHCIEFRYLLYDLLVLLAHPPGTPLKCLFSSNPKSEPISSFTQQFQ